jgi:hypothetical protein
MGSSKWYRKRIEVWELMAKDLDPCIIIDRMYDKYPSVSWVEPDGTIRGKSLQTSSELLV